jgi:hypothetical protein
MRRVLGGSADGPRPLQLQPPPARASAGRGFWLMKGREPGEGGQRPPPSWPALMPRNSAIRARHWSARALRSTRTSVETWWAAMTAQAITVFPAPGGATSTPRSCRAISVTASRWAGVKAAEQVMSRVVPAERGFGLWYGAARGLGGQSCPVLPARTPAVIGRVAEGRHELVRERGPVRVAPPVRARQPAVRREAGEGEPRPPLLGQHGERAQGRVG